MDMQDVFSAEDAAAALGITPGRVRTLMRDGRLPASRFAGCWMVLRANLALVQHRPPSRPVWVSPVAPAKHALAMEREG